VGKSRSIRDTDPIIGQAAKNHGGRPRGSLNMPGEQAVKKGLETIIITGSKRYKSGRLGQKELGDLAKVAESYTALLKMIAPSQSEEHALLHGAVGAYESMVTRANDKAADFMEHGDPGAYEEMEASFQEENVTQDDDEKKGIEFEDLDEAENNGKPWS
jgi:hypothetical protein